MNAQIISFHCVLKNRLGHVLSSSYNHEVLTSAPPETEATLPGLSRGLRDIKKGEKRSILLSADQAYGFYDVSKVFDLPRSDLKGTDHLSLGEKVFFARPGGEVELYRVTNLTADRVTLDANHPLAGQDLIFEIEATEVREATPEELSDSEDDSEMSGPRLH